MTDSRKVQRLGPSTLAITLPSDWVREFGVKKGDELGKVLHPLTSKILETCNSPLNGKIVSSRIKMPINPGGYIAHIADYDSTIWQK